MSDLISREALLGSLNPEYLDTRKLIEQGETHLDNLAEGYTEVYRLIKTAPSVDAVEVVHGHWIWVKDHWECSACRGNRFTNDIVLGLDAAYCSRCGAKMDEVSE